MKTLRLILLYLMIFLSVGTSLYAFFFFTIQMDSGSSVYQHFVDDPWVGYSHVFGGAIALLVGGFQFLPKLRSKYMNLHRTLGKIYLIAVLIGGTGGFFAAIDASGGLYTKIGFTLLAIGWLFTSVVAYRSILKKDVEKHQRWMIRSFALTLAAVSLRIQLPIYLAFFGFTFSLSYLIIAWSCWVPNLLIAEYIIKKH